MVAQGKADFAWHEIDPSTEWMKISPSDVGAEWVSSKYWTGFVRSIVSVFSISDFWILPVYWYLSTKRVEPVHHEGIILSTGLAVRTAN